MKDDQPHTFPDTHGDALDRAVLNFLVGDVAPPNEHIGLREARC